MFDKLGGDTDMKITTYQQKSPLKQECEDSFFCNEDKMIYGVCDGATPLVPFCDEEGHNGAYIASHLFASHFTSLREINSLQDEVAKANELLQNKMLEYKVDTRKKDHLWCTCIAAVQIEGDKLEYAQLGDCMIVAILQDGAIRVLTKDTVQGISKRAKKKREEDREKGLPSTGRTRFSRCSGAVKIQSLSCKYAKRLLSCKWDERSYGLFTIW